jgi:hypothetical protein
MTDSQSYLTHVASFEEVGWGIALIAITMMIHAFGMIVTLAAGNAMQERLLRTKDFLANIAALIATSWIIVFVHLSEVMVWAAFFVLCGAMPSMTAAYYYALLQYVTVGSELTLPVHWRLLGGLIGMAGLLTFAWSTTVLLFEIRQLQRLAQRRQHSAIRPGHDSSV